MNLLGLPVLMDGMNEKGLAGGLLNAPQTAVFQEVKPSEARRSIASYQLLNYVLTSFASVDDVKTHLPEILVNGSAIQPYNAVVRVHMTLHDAKGRSLSVEYLKGRLVMQDNPTGAYTNDPTFAEHLATLGNHGNLHPDPARPLTIGGTRFAAVSSGSGMAGLPGDALSTSRFVRAALLSHYAPTDRSTAEQVSQAFHLLNNFDLPPGMVGLGGGSTYGGGHGQEITEWSVVADQKNLTYYIRTHANPDVRSLDLRQLPLDGGRAQLVPLNQPQRITPLGLP